MQKMVLPDFDIIVRNRIEGKNEVFSVDIKVLLRTENDRPHMAGGVLRF